MKSVLIVEDHESIAETYKIMLESQDYKVIVTSDGEDCIVKFDEHLKNDTERVANTPFDLVVVDYHLPGKDGIDVIDHILSVSPRQRVLIASAYAANVIRKSAQMLQRQVELMVKPFELSDFVDAIEGRRATEIVGGIRK